MSNCLDGARPICAKYTPKSIIIRTKKEVSAAGDLGYRVIGIEALHGDCLPKEYVNDCPYCHYTADTKTLWVYATAATDTKPGTGFYFNIGTWYPREDFLRKLETIKQCGQRLHEINQKARAEREAWKGEEVFRI